jgi:hypothetical protein
VGYTGVPEAHEVLDSEPRTETFVAGNDVGLSAVQLPHSGNDVRNVEPMQGSVLVGLRGDDKPVNMHGQEAVKRIPACQGFQLKISNRYVPSCRIKYGAEASEYLYEPRVMKVVYQQPDALRPVGCKSAGSPARAVVELFDGREYRLPT